MRCKFNAVNQLFTIILVGLAANKPQTQSSTIRSLIFTIKKNVILNPDNFEDDNTTNMILSSDAGFQDFMQKASRIVVIFLKDETTPHELARSVLQFLKISITLLSVDHLVAGGIAKFVIDNMFQSKLNYHIKKHKLLVRRIMNKLIRKCGVQFVTKTMPEYHRPMIAYLEKEKRKKMNKKEKERLMALIGDVPQESGAAKEDEDDLSSEGSSDEENTQE